MRRWALWLVVFNVSATALLVLREEVKTWDDFSFYRQYPELDQKNVLQERLASSWFSEQPQDLSASLDYWPSAQIRGVYALNLPILLSTGWYKHDLSFAERPLLRPLFLAMVWRLPFRQRLISMDLLMLVMTGLQWWVLGRWLERRNSFWRSIPAKMHLACACMFAVFALLPHQDGGWILYGLLLPAQLIAFMAWLGWILLFVITAGLAVRKRFAAAAIQSS